MCSSAQDHFISQAFFSLVLIKDVLYRKHLPEKCLPYLRLLSIAYSTSILRCEIILFFFFRDATKMFYLLMWDDSHHHFGHSFFAGSHLYIEIYFDSELNRLWWFCDALIQSLQS